MRQTFDTTIIADATEVSKSCAQLTAYDFTFGRVLYLFGASGTFVDIMDTARDSLPGSTC